MITDFIFLIFTFVIGVIGLLLNTVSFAIPNNFEESLIRILSNFKYWEGVLPVTGLFEILAVVVSFLLVWYSVKIILKLVSLLPFVGKTKL